MSVGKFIAYFLKLTYRAAEYARGFWLYLIINACGGRCEGVPRVGSGLVLKYPPHKGIRIGRGCSIGPFCIIDVPEGGVLHIGHNVKLTAGVFIAAVNEVFIGDDCLIAEWVSIRDSQHRYSKGSNIREQGLELGSVVLESDVWIGRASSVFMGSVLKSGCVVGAHGLVKGKVLESDAVYVGVPVRKISERKM